MSKVLGERVVYNYILQDAFAALGFSGAKELADMFEFNRLHIPNRRADVVESRSLYPGMQSFEAWMKANKHQFQGSAAKA